MAGRGPLLTDHAAKALTYRPTRGNAAAELFFVPGLGSFGPYKQDTFESHDLDALALLLPLWTNRQRAFLRAAAKLANTDDLDIVVGFHRGAASSVRAVTIHRRPRQWQQRALVLQGAHRGLLHKLPDTPAAAPSSRHSEPGDPKLR